MRKLKIFICLMMFCSIAAPFSASASSISDDGIEILAEPESSADTDTESEISTEPSTESESTTTIPPESESTTTIPPESESNVAVPPESESGTESSTGQGKGPVPNSSDVIVPRYRIYYGRPQYRRWNETQKRWEDPVWLDGSASGIKKITLYTGHTMKLKIDLIKPKCASKRVFWKSKKPRIVYAYKNGRILAKRSGIAQIVAINRKTKRTVAKVKIIVRKG